jgi:hypothetical protein
MSSNMPTPAGRHRRHTFIGAALAAFVWTALSVPILLGRTGYGELNLVRTTILALATGAAPALWGIARDSASPPPAQHLGTTWWLAANAACGASAALIVITTQVVRSLGIHTIAGWMGEDLGAIAGGVLFLMATAFTSVGSVVTLLVDWNPPRQRRREISVSALHLGLAAVTCWLYLQ